MLMKNRKKFKAFTLIELIVAIIIVGITITAIPALLSSTGHLEEANLQEKSFFNAFSLLTILKMEMWDENNTKGDNYYKVLTSQNGDSELNCTRKGVIELNNSSGAVCADNDKYTSHIGLDSGEDENNESTFDDIDDFNNYITQVQDVNLSVRVVYADDSQDYTKKVIFFNETATSKKDSNVKKIELKVVNAKTGEVISVLRYFSSNIGMTKIESRFE